MSHLKGLKNTRSLFVCGAGTQARKASHGLSVQVLGRRGNGSHSLTPAVLTTDIWGQIILGVGGVSISQGLRSARGEGAESGPKPSERVVAAQLYTTAPTKPELQPAGMQVHTSGPAPLPSGNNHRDIQKRTPADGDHAFQAQDIRLRDQNQSSAISTQGQCLQNGSLWGLGWVFGFVFVLF